MDIIPLVSLHLGSRATIRLACRPFVNRYYFTSPRQQRGPNESPSALLTRLISHTSDCIAVQSISCPVLFLVSLIQAQSYSGHSFYALVERPSCMHCITSKFLHQHKVWPSGWPFCSACWCRSQGRLKASFPLCRIMHSPSS